MWPLRAVRQFLVAVIRQMSFLSQPPRPSPTFIPAAHRLAGVLAVDLVPLSLGADLNHASTAHGCWFELLGAAGALRSRKCRCVVIGGVRRKEVLVRESASSRSCGGDGEQRTATSIIYARLCRTLLIPVSSPSCAFLPLRTKQQALTEQQDDIKVDGLCCGQRQAGYRASRNKTPTGSCCVRPHARLLGSDAIPCTSAAVPPPLHTYNTRLARSNGACANSLSSLPHTRPQQHCDRCIHAQHTHLRA